MLLTQNSEMRADGVWNWTLPAWVAKHRDGSRFLVCPQAGACAQFCYARNGTYQFPAVVDAHVRNLEMVRDDLPGWTHRMTGELHHRRHFPTYQPRLPDLDKRHLPPVVARLLDSGAACIRIHDSGDFFSPEYLQAWLTIARQTPHIFFYAYTKEVDLLHSMGGLAPVNFRWCFSLGGKQDHLIDRAAEYHADVFPGGVPDGWYDQQANDLLCVTAPQFAIGIPANNIPRFNNRLAGRTFGQVEATTRRRRS